MIVIIISSSSILNTHITGHDQSWKLNPPLDGFTMYAKRKKKHKLIELTNLLKLVREQAVQVKIVTKNSSVTNNRQRSTEATIVLFQLMINEQN